MKKFRALLLAGALLAAIPVAPILAEGLPGGAQTIPGSEITSPAGTDKASIIVKNIEQGKKVIAYQIIEGKYNDDGYGLEYYQTTNSGFDSILGTSNPLTVEKVEMFKDTLSPKANQIMSKILSTGEDKIDLDAKYKKELSYDESSKEYKYKDGENNGAPVGLYIIFVEDGYAGAKVYNPMVASVSYIKDEQDGNKYKIAGTTITAKVSEPTITKKINQTTEDKDENETEDGAAFGSQDSIPFKINTNIPSYDTSVYTDPRFNITDTLSAGLSDVQNISVSIGGTPYTQAASGTYPFTVTVAIPEETEETEGPVIRIVFDSQFIKEKIGLGVEVNYTAKISQDHNNFNGTHNTVRLEYTNNPDPQAALHPLEDTTYQYTFAIDGNIKGSRSSKTEELVKVNENGGELEVVNSTEITESMRLAGAEFKMYEVTGTKADGTPELSVDSVAEATSDDDGRMYFAGLDVGTYQIIETKAPAGYSIDPNPITAEITADYWTEASINEVNNSAPSGTKPGMLKSYTITITNSAGTTATNTYTVEHTLDSGTTQIVVPDGENNVYPFKNTKIPNLPSTGGAGTYLFTIGGVVVMGAAGLMILRKRTSKS